MSYSMLNKSELKITDIHLDNTNLHDIADCVAEMFSIPRDKVLVIDVRNGEVALDILSDEVDPHSFIGREKKLLSKIAEIPGVTLGETSHITSEGMLGWIAFTVPDEDELQKSMDNAERMAKEIMERVSKRVLVYPSGTEVENGEIEDTNTPMLVKSLNEAGFIAEAGKILKDDETYIASMLRDGINHGYGTIITTGGVGAEDKDHSVEAVMRLDHEAAAPYIVKFEKGHGRHVKDGIRICVGQFDHVKIITLPGPNDEVRLCMPIVIEGLKNNYSKNELAEKLAEVLRNRLVSTMHKHSQSGKEDSKK